MKVNVTLSDCVDLFMQASGDKDVEPEVRACCILAAHTIKSLFVKKKKLFNKKVEIIVEVEGEQNEDNNSI